MTMFKNVNYTKDFVTVSNVVIDNTNPTRGVIILITVFPFLSVGIDWIWNLLPNTAQLKRFQTHRDRTDKRYRRKFYSLPSELSRNSIQSGASYSKLR